MSPPGRPQKRGDLQRGFHLFRKDEILLRGYWADRLSTDSNWFASIDIPRITAGRRSIRSCKHAERTSSEFISSMKRVRNPMLTTIFEPSGTNAESNRSFPPFLNRFRMSDCHNRQNRPPPAGDYLGLAIFAGEVVFSFLPGGCSLSMMSGKPFSLRQISHQSGTRFRSTQPFARTPCLKNRSSGHSW